MLGALNCNPHVVRGPNSQSIKVKDNYKAIHSLRELLTLVDQYKAIREGMWIMSKNSTSKFLTPITFWNTLSQVLPVNGVWGCHFQGRAFVDGCAKKSGKFKLYFLSIHIKAISTQLD